MFKLNTQRTYSYPVKITVFDGNEEQTGEFKATFKVPSNDDLRAPENADKTLLDMVLVGVEGIEVAGEDGQPLTGDALLKAVKADPAAATALVTAYQESVTKKNRPRT